MRQIPLTQGMVALVDDDNYEQLAEHRWCYQKERRKHTGYAVRAGPRISGRYQTIWMHRVIMEAGREQRVDHSDGNGLNNCKANLRFCTDSQNLANQNKCHRPTSSQYKGVVRPRRLHKWQSRAQVNGKGYHLGYFGCEEDAARAYNRFAWEAWGDFARLNDIPTAKENSNA
jgi:hypothetical protein